MANFNPQDVNFEARVRRSFARQTAMATLNIEIAELNAGEVELKMPFGRLCATAWFYSRRHYHHRTR
jgi:hypothetical protein